MPYKCFMLEPVSRIRVWARRYGQSSPNACPRVAGEYSYHDNMNLIGDFDFPLPPQGAYEDWIEFTEKLRRPIDDPMWPKVCECGAPFENSEICGQGQMFVHRLHKRSDSGELTTLREAPAGAMWRAWWMQHDGRYWDWDNQTEAPIICKTPGSEWNIDGRASNCTMKDDRLHRCWVRHGEPPNLTVDKNGLTCAAGAGSIQSGNYHGFLQGGCLTD